MLYEGIIDYHKTSEGANSKTEMKFSIFLFLAIAVYSVIANCTSEP